MAVAYTNGNPFYEIKWEGPEMFGRIALEPGSVAGLGGLAESDVDAAVIAFADVINAASQYPVSLVTKVYPHAYGVPDWTYVPPVP